MSHPSSSSSRPHPKLTTHGEVLGSKRDLHLLALFARRKRLSSTAWRDLVAALLSSGLHASDDGQVLRVSVASTPAATPSGHRSPQAGAGPPPVATVTEAPSQDGSKVIVVVLTFPPVTLGQLRSGPGSLNIQARALPAVKDQPPHLLVRLTDGGRTWRVALPFEVDPDRVGPVKLCRRRGELSIQLIAASLKEHEHPKSKSKSEDGDQDERRGGEDADNEDDEEELQDLEEKSPVKDVRSRRGPCTKQELDQILVEGHGGEQASVDDDDDEQICRYCFAGPEDGPLISPCRCTGGQRHVHLACLRRWQRMVVVSQPTHPAFWEDDVRHHKCNVCLEAFTCPPPSRNELMESFTGPELAALIAEGGIIGAHEAFSAELETRMEDLPEITRELLSYRHWIRGVYIITSVKEDRDREVAMPLNSQSTFDVLRTRLISSGLTISLRGQQFRLVAGGSLEDVPQAGLAEALGRLSVPVTLTFVANVQESDCGNDHVTAVNLSRLIARPTPRQLAQTAAALVAARTAAEEKVKANLEEVVEGPAEVEVQHFNGGPCDSESVSCCLVLGGHSSGWAVIPTLREAAQLAATLAVRSYKAQGPISCGQTVKLTGLKGMRELNGELGLAISFSPTNGRWAVRLRSGDSKLVRPENLEGLEGAGGRVLVFWGDAQWSRSQLLGEIARGHWGLCRANAADFINAPEDRWKGLNGRQAFAPVTEMTEDFMREALRQMASLRAEARLALLEGGHEEAEAPQEEEQVREMASDDL